MHPLEILAIDNHRGAVPGPQSHMHCHSLPFPAWGESDQARDRRPDHGSVGIWTSRSVTTGPPPGPSTPSDLEHPPSDPDRETGRITVGPDLGTACALALRLEWASWIASNIYIDKNTPHKGRAYSRRGVPPHFPNSRPPESTTRCADRGAGERGGGKARPPPLHNWLALSPHETNEARSSRGPWGIPPLSL